MEPRREPYWAAPVRRGCHIGLRKISAHEASWIARYRPEKGIQEYKSLGWLRPDFGHDQAKAAAELWFKEKATGATVVEIVTVADACRAYVKGKREDVDEPRPATARDAEARFERTVFDAPIGRIPVTKLCTKDLTDWRAGLELGKASKNRTLTALKAALHMAVKDKKAPATLAIELAGITPFENAGKRRNLYLDLRQRRALLKAASGAVRDLIEAAMLTGCRAGEIVNATCSQFDARQKMITVTGKTGERKVVLSPDAVKLFKRLAKDKEPGALLLVRDDGKPWSHSDWDELVRDAATKAKLPPGVCLYTLRHSWITTALQGGLAVSDVSQLCGTSADMIQKHYHHLVNAHVQARLAKVAMI